MGTSWIFERGHRLRLHIAGTDWPNAWAPPEPLSLAIDRRATRLVLPVLHGPSPIAERPRLPSPGPGVRQERYRRRAEPADHTDMEKPGGRERPDGVDWRIEHDVLERETTAVAASWGGQDPSPDGPGTFEHYGGEVTVSTVDPGRGRAVARATIRVTYPEVTAQSEARYTFSSDAETYHLHLELEVAEGDEVRWTRAWDRSFPRRLQ
jgi:hypothetical protein